MSFRVLIFWIVALPLAAQAWDVRVEVPFAKGQSLPQVLLSGTGDVVSGELDTSKGAILSVSHRIIRMGPILKFEWGLEFAQLISDGQLQQQTATTLQKSDTKLKQYGAGLGVNAQFWIPFVGVAAEMGLIERFHRYQYEAGGFIQDRDIARTWLRVGARWQLPLPVLKLYVAASYQEPLSKDRPVRVNSGTDLSNYLTAQGAGQEFQRMWTFGVGVRF